MAPRRQATQPSSPPRSKSDGLTAGRRLRLSKASSPPSPAPTPARALCATLGSEDRLKACGNPAKPGRKWLINDKDQIESARQRALSEVSASVKPLDAEVRP